MKRYKTLFEELSTPEALGILRRYDPLFPNNPSDNDIKKYRRQFSKKYHPDISKTGGEKLKDINASLDVLSGDNQEPEDFGQSVYRRYRNTKPADLNNFGDMAEHYGTPVWSWAGWSGGMPNSPDIYINSPEDINWVKKSAWEQFNKKKNPSEDDIYTFWNFDGSYLRGVNSVFANDSVEALTTIAGWHKVFDKFNKTKAVLVTNKKWKKVVTVIPINKNGSVSYDFLKLKHDAFNQNPGNDKDFMRVLKNILNGQGNEEI